MTQISVLFLCTGNICRSPTAEGVLRHKLAATGLGDRVRVDSAGTTDYHDGDSPDPRAIKQAALRGYDLRDLRARQIRSEDFHDFDLILGMDRGHMSRLDRMAPKESPARLALFLELAGTSDSGPEVPDPYYGGLPDYDHALDLIEPAVDRLIEVLKRDFL